MNTLQALTVATNHIQAADMAVLTVVPFTVNVLLVESFDAELLEV